MSEWKEEILVECLESLIDYRGKTPKKSEEGIVTLSAKSVKMGKIDYSQAYFISPDEYKKFMVRGFPKKGDILMTTEAPLGCIAKLDREDVSVAQRLLTLRGKKDVLDNDYLMYYLMSRRGQYELLSRASGSTVQGIKRSEFENVLIVLPELSEQKEIAKTLSNLDQKITLLREQNQTLEELAQTLFKRWFVEFEFPNKNGEPYKSSGGKMEESELGEIPEGWRVGEVSNFVNHSTKSVSPNKEPNKIFSHYSIPAFDSGRYPTKDAGSSILSNKYEVLENSILVSKLNPSTSRIWTVFQPCENGICSTEIQVFVPNTNAYAFSFGLFHYSGIKREMAQRASGTSSSHQRVRPGDILNIEFVVPKEETLKKFEYSVLGSLKKIEENQEEIQSLTQLRDTLLPKLMSGELRVKE